MRATALRWRLPRPAGLDPLSAALAAEGLGAAGGPWAADPLDLALRLRRALAGLGPVPRAFGRHLAMRSDLLPPAASDELAALSAGAVRLGPSEVAARIEAELRRPLSEVFPIFAFEPLTAGAFRQRHLARTAQGRDVEVVLALPENLPAAEPDEVAPLAVVLDAAGLPGSELLSDFRRDAVAEVDVAADAEALAELAGLTLTGVAVPVVDPVLSRGAVLVHSAIPGLAFDRREGPCAAPAEALRRVALVWLRQLAAGRVLPLSPLGPGTRRLADGQVALVAGPFAVLPAASQENLWSYLQAVAVDDPATAAARLLPELLREAGAESEPELLLRLRQVVAFRDGTLGEGADPLADHVLASLRIARRCGYRLRRPAADFVRGLSDLARGALALAPGSEPVRQALDELLLRRSASDLRQALDPLAWARLTGPYAALLPELPRKLDAVLDLLSRGEASVRLRVEAPVERRGGGATLLALAAIAGAAVLAAPRIGELLAAGASTGVAAAALAAALVATLVWRR